MSKAHFLRTSAVILLILAHYPAVILRLVILIALMSVSLQAAPSKSRAMRELAKNAPYQKGAKAMADNLPDLAVSQFRASLEIDNLSDEAKSSITIALAEALIRSSVLDQGSDQQATEALQILAKEELKDLPSTPIWNAEALAVLGRYLEAESALSNVDQKHPRYREIQLIRARILIALNRTELALQILTTLGKEKSSATSNSAKLLAAEIYIDLGKSPAALKLLENVESENPATTRLKYYIQARLALAENRLSEAAIQFRSLVTAPDHLSKKIYNACVLGLADALTANKQNDEAIATLEDYITKHPNSTILQPVFQRLGKLLPPDLPADNPSLKKLIDWSGESAQGENILYIVGDTSDSIRPYQPAPSEYDDLVTLSIHLRAQLLARSENPIKNPQALFLLNRLRSLHPAHTLPPSELYMQLSSASLLDTAEIQLKNKHPEQAAFTLAVMKKSAFSPILKDQASFLLGLLLAKEVQYDEALASFNFSRESTSEEIATAASINAGITSLLSSDLTVFNQILTSTHSIKIRNALQLERALWKCRNNDISGRADLDTYIIEHLGSSRENEARMALAAACVDIAPADIMLSKAQLDIITPRLTDHGSQYGITRIRIRAEELIENWTAAAAIAESFIRNYKDSTHVPALMLKQGEAYYHNEDFNQARRIFQSVNDQFPDSPFSPYASFYTAMAARLGGTTQAREESVLLFQKIIDGKHPLAAEARIQQSRVLIDLLRYKEAESTLKPLIASKDTSASLLHDAGVLMTDCLHRQAALDPSKYEEAITIYDGLLQAKDLPLAWNNQLHFLRGQTLQSMNRPAEALDSYYSVIVQKNALEKQGKQDVEWFWFYRCGFKALSMLESDKRWESAVKLARRMASFDGPRAEEASKRANNLAKQHMIWEEEKTPPQAIEIKK